MRPAMRLAAMVVSSVLLAAATAAGAAPVTIAWEAEASTVVDDPFGVEVPRLTAVTGYLTFDTDEQDEDDDERWGAYPHDGNGAFRADFLGHVVLGSTTPYFEVYNADSPSNDTFRLVDGPRPVGDEGGVMRFDGVEDDGIQLWLSIVDDVQDDDSLQDVFALYDFGFLGTPHTFSLEDESGTMLLQLTKVATAVCGDPTGSGITTSDALRALRAAVGSAVCYACQCDLDANGKVTSGDALKVLRYAVGSVADLDCGPCL